MTGKPKSHNAMVQAVQYCNHPEIDDKDKHMLMCYALNSDYGLGTNARPGNRNLEGAAHLKKRMVQYRNKRLEARGLVMCTEEAHGRGKASVYTLNLSSPYFPDQTPNGVWLIENMQSEDSGSEKTCNTNTENMQPDERKHAMQDTKTCNANTENMQPKDCDTPHSHQKPTQEHTHTPTPKPAPLRDAAAKSVSVDSWAQFISNIPEAMAHSQFFKTESTVKKLIRRLGVYAMVGICRAWYPSALEHDGLFATRATKWQAFLDALPRYIPKAAEYDKRERERQWQESPEGIAAQAVAQEKKNEETFAQIAWQEPTTPERDYSNDDPLAGCH